ncbi:class E sortase [Streptomyces sp. NPDC006285]|uniref:class E sortase n=1 Tax=Streptomyces sp. NPDC006285 TaxID=3364742 RepID=UPI00368054AF
MGPGAGLPDDGRTGNAMRAAVDGLADPLSDPLPGGRRPAAPEQGWYDPQAYAPDWSVGQNASTYADPVRGAHTEPAHGYSAPRASYTPPQQSYPQPQPQQPYGQAGAPHAGQQPAYTGPQPPYAQPQQPYAGTPQAPYARTPQPTYPGAPQTPYDAAYAPTGPVAAPVPGPQAYARPYGGSPAADETVALPVTDAESTGGPRKSSTPSAGPVASSGGVAAPGGRAARRKASRRHGRHGGAAGSAADEAYEEPTGDEAAQAPTSRAAARRAAKARKPGVAVLASRAIGEVFITAGVLMLLFVTYQLYWTNIRAQAQADSAASSLQNDWANGKRNPGTFEPGQGFALLHIPKLDVVVPIAEGIDKKRVLDRGMVGHYAEEGVKTAMPDAKTGNFGLAGHRNTHGEPFRYVNRLKPGDPIVVETQDTYFVYEMASILPVTAPSNTSVLDAIPKGSTFKKAGRYITLTTCTPEFTSKYRMIVWGTMVEERSRDKGKPDALVG